jgi:hypothetical protein
VPKATNLFNNAREKGRVRTQRNTKKASQQKLLTSLGEIVYVWASRETSVSLAFFKRLRFWGTGTFLTEALVTLCTISWAGGSSSTTCGIRGVAVASIGSSSSSLHEENKLCVARRKQGKNGAIEELEQNTYDARRSKNSISSTRAGALSAAAELEEANSSTRFLFLSTPASSASTGGGDVDELVSSSDSSASSPS